MNITALRIKAFIVDMFMIMMPLAYITTYFVLDGKDDFLSNVDAKWIIALLYGVIIIVLWSRQAQTLGMRAYDIEVILENGSRLTYLHSLIRYCVFLLCMSTIFPVFYLFFNKEKKTVWDILSKSKIQKTTNLIKEL